MEIINRGRLYIEVPSLLSVDEHNAKRKAEKEEYEREARRTGVSCPKCGKELTWKAMCMGYALTLRYPLSTTRPAECKECSLTVELET